MRRLGVVCALVLAFIASGASADHKNPACLQPEEIFDELSASIPANFKMVKFDRADALHYIDLLFKFTGGGTPPFDLSKVKGGIIIFSAQYPKVYAGVIDGDKGEVCHAAAIDSKINRAIVAEIQKGKS